MNRIHMKNFLIIMVLSMCLVCLLPLYLINTYSEEYLMLTLLVSGFAFLLFFIKHEQYDYLKGQHFKISSLFLLGFCIVHFQFYIDLSLNYADLSSIYVINPNVLNKSAVVSAIALFCFFIGYISNQSKFNLSNIKTNSGHKARLEWLKLILVLLFFGTILSTPWQYFTSGYITVERQEIAIVMDRLFLIVTTGYFILSIRNLAISKVEVTGFFHFVRLIGVFISALLIIYCLLILMSGNRGPIIKLLLAYIGCYIFITRKKYNLAVVFFMILIAASMISLMAHIRHLDNISSPIEAFTEATERKSGFNKKQTISSSTEELSRSVRTLHAAIDYTQADGYALGSYKITGVIALVPGLGRILQPVDKDAKSTNLLTEHIGADHGMGTSAVADIWVDYGLLGTILVFFTLGWLFRQLDIYSYSHLPFSILSYAIVISFLTSSIYIGRGAILDVFRDAIHIWIVISMAIFLNKLVPLKFKSYFGAFKNLPVREK